MAQPSTEVVNFRQKVSRFVNDLRELDAILAIIEDHGVDDAARVTFFTPALVNQDITMAEFTAGIVALRAIRTARDAQKIAIAKLLI